MSEVPPRHSAVYRFLPGVCRWCGAALPSRRTVWCSDVCSDKNNIRRSASFARYKVEQRDKGVCARCGTDTAAKVGIALEMAMDLNDRAHAERLTAGTNFWSSVRVGFLRSLPPWANHERGEHTWEMNHILPVYLGGGSCGLENLETLCIACHAAVGREQAAERAADRRAAELERKRRLVAEQCPREPIQLSIPLGA